MQLRVLTLDFESHFSDEYSLSRMTPMEYICDSRWEVIGAGARMDTFTLPMPAPSRTFSTKARWVDGPDLPKLFERIDWSKTALMSHNIGFDGAVLAWRYGIVPALYIDTLGMCRAMMPEAKGASLAKALSFIGAPPKGNAIVNAKGMRRADLMRDPRVWKEYTDYAIRDTDGCTWLFEYLAHGFSGTDGVGTIHRNEEFIVMDMVARMTIIPQFSLDTHVLSQHLAKVKADKALLMKRLQDACILDSPDAAEAKRALMSNQRYAGVLERLGVEPPRKISLKTGKETYAFSKTDPEFVALLEHEDPMVQAVAAARLGFKSTQEETRTERFLKIAGLNWPAESCRTVDPALVPLPRMPFPLCYSGAHTHRLSGAFSINLQNLGRDSKLRSALTAPPGYVVVSADASQIEARIVSWLAGCKTLVDAFDRGEDVYSTFASSVYGFSVNKHDHPTERFVGKTAVLGLGFGMGAPKFVFSCWVQSKRKTKIDLDLGIRTVNTYRTMYHEIPAYWRAQDNVIHMLSTRTSGMLGVLIVDGPSQSIILPNGMRLYYTNMRKEYLTVPGDPDQKREQWLFDYGRETKYTFGGKMTENCLSGDTLVLTEDGWKRIDCITTERVWDGEQWVSHGGLVDQGEQETLCLDGVWMTPDHEVLTEHGWVNAVDADGHNRRAPVLPDGMSRGWVQPRGQDSVGVSLQLRFAGKRQAEILHLHEARADLRPAHGARRNEEFAQVLPFKLPGGSCLLHDLSPLARRRERVFDLLDCGPNHRFVVAGEKGPVIVHNCVQALARIITMNAAVRVRRIVGKREKWARPLAGQIHDQLTYVVPVEIAQDFLAVVIEEMSRRLDWFATLPLAAEGGIGNNLLEAK